MNESNWWVYLLGAVMAYVLIPWRAVFKWLAVAVCVWVAYSLFTSAALPPIYQWAGGIFFGLIAISAARSEYRVDDPQPPRKKDTGGTPKLRKPCSYCNDTRMVACYCPGKRHKPDIFGAACFECNDTKYKRCYMCH